jgi:hypothetical protein
MTMAKVSIRGFIVSAVLTATLSVVLMGVQVRPAAAACFGDDGGKTFCDPPLSVLVRKEIPRIACSHRRLSPS